MVLVPIGRINSNPYITQSINSSLTNAYGIPYHTYDPLLQYQAQNQF
jgi:hypothetical protein